MYLTAFSFERTSTGAERVAPLGGGAGLRRNRPTLPRPGPLPGADLLVPRAGGHGRLPAERSHGDEMLSWAVAAAFAVPIGEIRAGTRRSARVAFARQAAMYLGHVGLGLTYSEIGRMFGRDRTTAAHACKLVEDRREDPRVDVVLAALESVCQRLCSGGRRWGRS